jgi:Rha family phage regulatory protein
MSGQMSAIAVMPSMSLSQGRAVVSSLVVAEHFGKQHKDVLREIRRTMEDLPEDFNGRNFAPVEYRDTKGESRPAYNLTRDGFTLLAMGFTGRKAMAWKVRYIEAFNAMEAEILRLREAHKALPSAEAVRAAKDHHLYNLGRACMEPTHPLAETWRREATEFMEAANLLK